MKIQVEMTAEEFQEFMAWKADKKVYDGELRKAGADFEYLNNKILWALDFDNKTLGKVKIINQEHAAELIEMAKEHFC